MIKMNFIRNHKRRKTMTNATQDAGADDYNDEGEVPHDDGGDADIDDDDEDDEDLELFFSMQRMAGVVEEDEKSTGTLWEMRI